MRVRIVGCQELTRREDVDHVDSTYFLSILVCCLSNLIRDHMLLSEQTISV